MHAPGVFPTSKVSLRSYALSRAAVLVPFRLSPCKAHAKETAPNGKGDILNDVPALVFTGFAATLTSTATAAHADDVTTAVGDVTTGSAGGFGSGEAVLLLTPVLVYALFNVYRDRINPQAKFLDYIFILAALAIFGNILSILIFKTRFF